MNKERTSELPTNKRSCTDILCGIIFILFLIATFGVSVYGFINGETSRILQPYDVDSVACGKGEAADFPYLFWNNTL